MKIFAIKQVVILSLLSLLLGLGRFFLMDDDFTLIKRKPELKKLIDFGIPEFMTEPCSIDLNIAKYLFDNQKALFIDSREFEEFNLSHIKNAINVPFDFFDEYETLLDQLPQDTLIVIYCGGDECSLSYDLGEYLFYDRVNQFKNVLVFDGGITYWQEAGYPLVSVGENDNTQTEKFSFTDYYLLIIMFLGIVLSIIGSFKMGAKDFFLNQKVQLMIKLVLGVMFIYASLDKIWDPAAFSDNIDNYQFTPVALNNIAALIIPWLELIVGLCFLSSVFLEGALTISIGLMIFFIFIMMRASILGIDIHCGCFSNSPAANGSGGDSELIIRSIEDVFYLGLLAIVKLKNIINRKEENEYK